MNNIKRVNISNFNEQQKTNYIKNLLYNNDINDVLSIILEYENKKFMNVESGDLDLDTEEEQE